MAQVEWLHGALQDLAVAWTNSSDRAAVNNAVAELELALGRNPEGVGESRGLNVRIAFFAPLAVRFEVSPGGRVVVVQSLWSYSPRSSR